MPIGSKFDEFLKEEGILKATTEAARQKLLALQEAIVPAGSSQSDVTPTKDNGNSIQVKLD